MKVRIDIVKKVICDPVYRFNLLSKFGLLNFMPDEKYIKYQYYCRTGKQLDLNKPERFNEKLQWLKLNFRDPKFTVMVDKYQVKEYVSNIIGEEYVVPLLGVWDNFESIDFDKLPEKFVLKTTHGSGGVFVCRDKQNFDYKKARKSINASLGKNYFYHAREWPYKDVIPRIIAEEYLQDGQNENLTVYKVFNFNGHPELIQTIQDDKTKNETIDYFDTEWNLLELRQNYPNSKTPVKKPVALETILKLSESCSEGFPFLRTDWYSVNGKVYFSEFTFFSDAGYEPFFPDCWDIRLGKKIVLPNR